MNIEEHRQPWESDEHWVFRKEFITIHQGKFGDDRLLCLAQVFANVELLGCNYPAAVMTEVNHLAAAITNLDDLRRKRIEKATVKFVNSSDGGKNNSGYKRKSDEISGSTRIKSALVKIDGSHGEYETDSGDKCHIFNTQSSNELERTDGNFSNSNLYQARNIAQNQTIDWMDTTVNNFDSGQSNTETESLNEKFKKLIEVLQSINGDFDNPDTLDRSCKAASVKIVYRNKKLANPRSTQAYYGACIIIEGVQVAYAEAPKKQQSRPNAYSAAIGILLNPNFHLVRKLHGNFEVSVESKNQNFSWVNPNTIRAPKPENESFIRILNNSAGLQQTWEKSLPEGLQTTNLQVAKDGMEKVGSFPINFNPDKDLLLFSDLGIRDSANYVTAINMTAGFNRLPYQMEVSQHIDEQDDGKVKNKCQVKIGGKMYGEFIGGKPKQLKFEAAKDAWINMQKTFYTVQMQRLVAARGAPLTSEIIMSGLGNFKSGLKEILRTYLETDTSLDLSFSPTIGKKEREDIKKIAKSTNVRYTCIGGKGPNRRVILSKRYLPKELLDHLVKNGGSTKKYLLIPPTG